jgi:hypothetical protein
MIICCEKHVGAAQPTSGAGRAGASIKPKLWDAARLRKAIPLLRIVRGGRDRLALQPFGIYVPRHLAYQVPGMARANIILDLPPAEVESLE